MKRLGGYRFELNVTLNRAEKHGVLRRLSRTAGWNPAARGLVLRRSGPVKNY